MSGSHGPGDSQGSAWASAVAPLAELESLGRERYGGKAAMLAAMLGDGRKVIDGLAVSADAYEAGLRQAGASGLAEEFWDRAAHGAATSGTEELSAEIARRLHHSDLSGIAAAVLARLNPDRDDALELMVRSSATGEDSNDLSYAGQFVSRRCLATGEELAQAIATVWASCTAPNVAAYRVVAASYDRGARTDPPSMGLVVQPYWRFSLSGLAFTQHPVVPLRGWMLLEYLDEQPDRLVSGEVLPHACRVNVSSGQLLWERRVEGRPALAPQQVAELVEGCCRVKRFAGVDVDVEWGMRQDDVYFLQARPATTRPTGI